MNATYYTETIHAADSAVNLLAKGKLNEKKYIFEQQKQCNLICFVVRLDWSFCFQFPITRLKRVEKNAGRLKVTSETRTWYTILQHNFAFGRFWNPLEKATENVRSRANTIHSSFT